MLKGMKGCQPAKRSHSKGAAALQHLYGFDLEKFSFCASNVA